MELRVKKPALVLAMGVLVLALAGIGCGDDDGGGSGGTSGSGGTGGTAGTAGTSGTGGNTPTIAECAAAAMEAADVEPLGTFFTTECTTCICTASVAKTVDCNENANCWDFVNCAVVVCQGDSACYFSPESGCLDFVTGSTPAAALTEEITGCRDTCFPAVNMDGGDTDGGN